MTENSGRAFHFSLPAIAQIDAENGQCVIAHEFAHAHLYAEQALGLLDSAELRAYSSAIDDVEELVRQIEVFADQRLAQWGFDPERLRLWSDEYLRRHVR